MAWAKTVDEAKVLLGRAEVRDLQLGGIGKDYPLLWSCLFVAWGILILTVCCVRDRESAEE